MSEHEHRDAQERVESLEAKLAAAEANAAAWKKGVEDANRIAQREQARADAAEAALAELRAMHSQLSAVSVGHQRRAEELQSEMIGVFARAVQAAGGEIRIPLDDPRDPPALSRIDDALTHEVVYRVFTPKPPENP